MQYAIPKIKMLCNLCCLKTRLRLLCNKSSTAQQPEPRFETAEVMKHTYFRNGVLDPISLVIPNYRHVLHRFLQIITVKAVLNSMIFERGSHNIEIFLGGGGVIM